jgi:hypothetical protein
MAVETVTRTTCDRCKNLIEETPDSSSGEDRGGKPILYIEFNGEEVVKYLDLCQKCDDRCTHLLKQLRLEKPDSDDKKPEEKENGPDKPKKGKNKNKDAVDAATAAS